MTAWFVAGTDTAVGKTLVSAAILYALQKQGRRVAGMKPVASGAEPRGDCLVSQDVETLKSFSSVSIADEIINPYIFEPAIAPHIAAAQAKKSIDPSYIKDCLHKIFAQTDDVIVEGVGGWHTPLGDSLRLSDIVRMLALPVVLVVGMRLGCLNHALLSVDAIRSTGVPLVAWVANSIDPDMAHQDENLDYLQQHIPAPLLGVVPYQQKASVEEVSLCLDLNQLTSGIGEMARLDG